ncbi:MAG: hypothetical protein HY327_14030 [Chloroflexi bacterium]|nr:hypothetical protein [Chloroflexota bacterium]
MYNPKKFSRRLIFLVVLLAACSSALSKPSAVITSPANGTDFREGDQVVIESISEDARAIVRVELLVDSVVVKTDVPPTAQGQPALALAQSWNAIQGAHTISVRAYNADGLASDPVEITVNVAPSIAQTAPTTAATSAPTASPAPTRACTNAAIFVSETIPDRTNFPGGAAFDKIWRLRNSGTCEWGSGYTFGNVAGEALTDNTSIVVPATAVNAIAELRVPMIAPNAAGLHSGAWQLKSDAGVNFGPRVTIIINVSASTSATAPSAPATLSAAACSGAPTLSTFTVTTEQITLGNSTRIQWGLVTNASSVRIDPDLGAVETPGFRDVSPRATTTYTLSARCGTATRTAQITITVNPAGATNANFVGAWVHNFGTLTVVQSGTVIVSTSKYTNEFTTNKASGNLAGSVSSNTLIGKWTLEGVTDAFTFYLSADGNSFDGSGTNGAQQFRWCGARPGAAFPTGCSFAGLWTIALPAVPACTALTLTRVDDSITGNLCSAPLSGAIKYSGAETVFSGNALVNGANNPFTLYLLDGYNGTQFNGNWNNNSANEWCGWRGNAPKPTQCGR